MSFDVFISHPHQDKAIADAVCAQLEADGIRCWIAPRDIPPGAEWAGAIVEAIDRCRVMVLIFSSSANGSKQIHREVQRAFDREVPVLPFRIENIAPDKSLAYYMGPVHWLDALTTPIEHHLRRLAVSVNALVREENSNAESREPVKRRQKRPEETRHRQEPAGNPPVEMERQRLGGKTNVKQPDTPASRRPLLIACTLGLAFVAVVGGFLLYSSRILPPNGKSEYSVQFSAEPRIQTDDDYAITMLGHVGTPFVGALSAKAAWVDNPNFVLDHTEIESPSYGLFQAVIATTYRDVPYQPGAFYDDDNTIDGVKIIRSKGSLAGVPKAAGIFKFLPAIVDRVFGASFNPFNSLDKLSGDFTLQKKGYETWMVSNFAIALLVLSEISFNDANRVSMQCQFENANIGTIAFILDYRTNFVEVAGNRTSETAGVFHLNVKNRSLLSWSRLPRNSFPTNFRDKLISMGDSSNVNQVSLRLDTGLMNVNFGIGDQQMQSPKKDGEAAHCVGK
jgi:hypothetical protein